MGSGPLAGACGVKLPGDKRQSGRYEREADMEKERGRICRLTGNAEVQWVKTVGAVDGMLRCISRRHAAYLCMPLSGRQGGAQDGSGTGRAVRCSFFRWGFVTALPGSGFSRDAERSVSQARRLEEVDG